MKYTKEQRLDIGRKIYDREITKVDAAEKYDIGEQTARSYMRLYRDTNHLPPMNAVRTSASDYAKVNNNNKHADLDELEAMSKEELIKEIIKSRIREARLKKGYEVKGDGTIILYDSKNIR